MTTLSWKESAHYWGRLGLHILTGGRLISDLIRIAATAPTFRCFKDHPHATVEGRDACEAIRCSYVGCKSDDPEQCRHWARVGDYQSMRIDGERLRFRVRQLEQASRASPPYVPHELTDEEMCGAPIAPWRRDSLRGPPLNEASWEKCCADYERDMAEWRAR